MPERTLIARVRPDEDDPATLVVSSPVVGRVDGVPRPGVFLNGFDALLRVTITGRTHVLRLPRDLHGWVVQSYLPAALTAVTYDQPLLRLDPRVGESSGTAIHGFEPTATADAEAGEAIIVTAPTDGIFYRRPAPDAPNFVEVGSPVVTGTVLGLVEVMKCFNQITYGGPGLPTRGEVVRILVEDGGEVKFAQALLWIRP